MVPPKSTNHCSDRPLRHWVLPHWQCRLENDYPPTPMNPKERNQYKVSVRKPPGSKFSPIVKLRFKAKPHPLTKAKRAFQFLLEESPQILLGKLYSTTASAGTHLFQTTVGKHKKNHAQGWECNREKMRDELKPMACSLLREPRQENCLLPCPAGRASAWKDRDWKWSNTSRTGGK